MSKRLKWLLAMAGLVASTACASGGDKKKSPPDSAVLEFAGGYNVSYTGYYEDDAGKEEFGPVEGYCAAQQIGPAVLYCINFLALAGADAASFDDEFTRMLYGIPYDAVVTGSVDTSGASLTVNGAWHISDPPYEYEVHYDIAHVDPAGTGASVRFPEVYLGHEPSPRLAP